VTTFAIAEDFRVRGSSLEVDLTSYSASNGLSLILASYGTFSDGPFNSITVTGIAGATWTQDVDYTIDLGDGSADTLSLTIIPEPGTYALIGGMLALGYVMVRRRR
jgi:hypothetical protein